jgi:hypothetical protein
MIAPAKPCPCPKGQEPVYQHYDVMRKSMEGNEKT